MRSYALINTAVFFLLFSALPAAAAPPLHFWSQSYGGTGSDQLYGVSAVDADGNVYISGQFAGTSDFGGGPLMSVGNADVVIAKYDSDGIPQWSQGFGGPDAENALAVAVDPSGNIYCTGWFQGTSDYGTGGLVSAGSSDIFLAKYDSDGNPLWSKRLGGTDVDQGGFVCTDPSGNVYVGGTFRGTVDFGGGNLVSAGGDDIFVAKYDATGTHLWSLGFGDSGRDEVWGMTSAGSDLLVIGDFHGTVDFGGGGIVSAGGSDVFLAKFDAAGTHLWSRGFGSTNDDYGYRVAAGSDGGIVFTGEISGSTDFGGGSVPFSGGSDIFLVKFDSAGAHQWSRAFGGTGYDGGWTLSLDNLDNVIVGGWVEDTVDFGGGPMASAGSADIWAAKFDYGGNHVWSSVWGGAGYEYAASMVIGPDGNLVMLAMFDSSLDMGGGLLTSLGGYDVALAKYAPSPASPVIRSIVDIPNDQGRKVKIRFDRSGYDQAGSSLPILAYEAYRRDDAGPGAPGILDTATFSGRDPSGRTGLELLAEGWTFVGSVPAHGETGYGLDAPTIGDSTVTAGQYFSTFYIRGATSDPYSFFDSAPDSGYSLDNLAPAAPLNLVYNAGTLGWDESSAEDFDYFTVYGANVDAFGSAVVVDYTVSPALDVTSSPYGYYFVTATDFSGNEGLPSGLQSTVGVGKIPERFVLSVSSFPNPFSASTTVSYTVPVRGRVTVAVYDARGARVAVLADRVERDPGPYRLEWDGRTDTGVRAPSGVYFARIEQAGSSRSKRMMFLK